MSCCANSLLLCFNGCQFGNSSAVAQRAVLLWSGSHWRHGCMHCAKTAAAVPPAHRLGCSSLFSVGQHIWQLRSRGPVHELPSSGFICCGSSCSLWLQPLQKHTLVCSFNCFHAGLFCGCISGREDALVPLPALKCCHKCDWCPLNVHMT